MKQKRIEQLRRDAMQECGFGVEAMKQLRVCGQCGNPSPEKERICGECGSRLPEHTLYDVYKARHAVCAVCETVIAKESAFCPQCGAKQ